VVSSGYRSPELNKQVGGSATSDHCLGYAADIEVPRVSNYDLARYIKDNLKFTQLILEFHDKTIKDSGWVHVSYNPENMKNQCLTAVKEQGKTKYLTGIV
jgi:zinc D-Ala-D-Ala carboxypeptidase